MTTPTARPVLLVPPNGPRASRLRGILEAAGVSVLTADTSDGAQADVAILDVAGAAEPALSDLWAKLPRIAVLAVCELHVALDPKVLEIVTPGALEAELLPRLTRVSTRIVMLREAQQRQRDLKVLIELTGRYAEATDVEELMHFVTRRLVEELYIDRAALVVVDAERQQGTVVAASDDAALKDKDLRLDLALYPEIREAVRTTRPVIVEDAPSHPLLEGVRDQVTAQGISSIAALPLTVRGKVLGVLLLRRSSPRGAFNSREVEFLTSVAQATAVAFRNVRLIESVRGQREQEKSARIAAEERAVALQRYEAYFEHLSDGVAILDARACVHSLNPAGLALLDVSAKDAVGRHINALTNPTDDGVLVDALWSVSQGQVRTDIDLHARTIGGRRLTLSVSAAPLSGTSPSEGIAILTMRDVTRQRLMADELRRTKEFLERLIDSSVDAVIAADLKGNIVLFNKAAEVICGYTAGEVIGKLNVRNLYPVGEAQQLMRKLRGPDFGGPGRLTTSRVEIISKDGDRIPVNMTASIIYEGTREVATVGIFTDLRDRLNLERKLTDAEARLLESEKNAVIVALAGTAAHELNQPLTSVMGYAELLKRKLKDNDPSFRSVDIIHREAERMAEIVRKIGKITRYETKSYVGASKIVDLDKAAGNEE